MSTLAPEPAAQHGPPVIHVTVVSPRETTPRQFSFEKTMRVGDAAREAADAFGYTGGSPTFARGDLILDRNKPLVAEGVREGDELELVDAGGGV
ncbi:MAG: hypothetical protein U0838_06965 [Chloroflexota bacterium]